MVAGEARMWLGSCGGVRVVLCGYMLWCVDMCAQTLFVCELVGCVVFFSFGSNMIGDRGAAAIGAGLHGVPSLTSLKYVIQAWVMCMMRRGQAEWCDG